MRVARHGAPGRETPIVTDDDGVWRDLRPLTDDVDGAFLSKGWEPVRAALAAGTLPEVSSDITRFGPPLVNIGKIICIGLNYIDHIWHVLHYILSFVTCKRVCVHKFLAEVKST